jgi:DNA-binding MarR family transcriptional regulator
MSVEATTWAWRQDLPGGEKLVLLAVADWTFEGHDMFNAQKKLAARVGISTRALSTNLTRLEERGLLTRHERFREDGGRSTSVIRLPIEGSSGGL